MFEFLLGVVSGGVIGAAASFVKNPSTHEPIRDDIRKCAEDLKDSCTDVKNNYQQLQNERSNAEVAPATNDETTSAHISVKDKANDLVSAVKTVANKNKNLNNFINEAKQKAKEAKEKAKTDVENVKSKVSQKNTEVKEELDKQEDKIKKELSQLKEKAKNSNSSDKED